MHILIGREGGLHNNANLSGEGEQLHKNTYLSEGRGCNCTTIHTYKKGGTTQQCKLINTNSIIFALQQKKRQK